MAGVNRQRSLASINIATWVGPNGTVCAASPVTRCLPGRRRCRPLSICVALQPSTLQRLALPVMVPPPLPPPNERGHWSQRLCMPVTRACASPRALLAARCFGAPQAYLRDMRARPIPRSLRRYFLMRKISSQDQKTIGARLIQPPRAELARITSGSSACIQPANLHDVDLRCTVRAVVEARCKIGEAGVWGAWCCRLQYSRTAVLALSRDSRVVMQARPVARLPRPTAHRHCAPLHATYVLLSARVPAQFCTLPQRWPVSLSSGHARAASAPTPEYGIIVARRHP